MKSHTPTIGPIIRRRRLLAGLTQEQLAFSSGLNRGYISLLEQGMRNPQLKTLQKLALALEVPLTTIIFELEYSDK